MKKLLFLIATVALVPTMLAGQNKLPLAKSRNTAQPVNNHLTELKSLSGTKKRLDNTCQLTYNTATGLYDNNYREEYLYDDFGVYQKATCSVYDTLTKAWVFTDEFTNIYDEAGKLIRVDIRSLDLAKNEWGSSKKEYEYDSNERVITLTISNWLAGTSQWSPSGKDEMEYSENGNLLKTITLLPDSLTGEWTNSLKVENSYNTSNLETNSHEYSWDIASVSWVNANRDTTAYDDNNNLILNTRYTWNNTSNTWEPLEKYTVTYDLNNDPFNETTYKWTTDRWTPAFQYGFSCDASFSRNDLILPDFWINYPMFIHLLSSETVRAWDEATGEFMPLIRASFSYSDFNSGIDQPTVSRIKVFPNPASGVIIIESGQLLDEAWFDLFDVQGRKVLSEKLSGSRIQLPLSEIAGGFYYYRISKSKTLAEGKIMIR